MHFLFASKYIYRSLKSVNFLDEVLNFQPVYAKNSSWCQDSHFLREVFYKEKFLLKTIEY